MRDLMSQWEDSIQSISQEVGIRPDLFRALVRQESRGNPKAVSPRGAVGLTQLMPEAAKEVGVNRFDPLDNLRGGAKYLKKKLDEFGGDETLAVAAYNRGAGGVRKDIQRGGLAALPAETRDYLKKVLGVDVTRSDNAPEPGRQIGINVPQYFSNEDVADREKKLAEYRAQQEEANQRHDSFGELLKTSAEEDFFVPSFMSYLERVSLKDDPNWMRPTADQVAKDLGAGGLGLDFLPRAMEMQSQAQYDLFMKQASEEHRRNEFLAQNGWRGTAARTMAGLVDPVSLAVAVGTGGIGLGAKLGRAGYLMTQGAINAAANGAFEAAMVGMKETRGYEDVLASMAGGFLLGSAVSYPMYREVLGDVMAKDFLSRSATATHTLREDLGVLDMIDSAKKSGNTGLAESLLGKLTPANREAYLKSSTGAAQAEKVEHVIFEPRGLKQTIQEKIDEIESQVFQDVLDENAQRTVAGKGIDWLIGKARWDAAGRLLERQESRAKLLGRIGENGVGTDSSGRSTGYSGEEYGRRLRHVQETAWLRDVEEAFEDYDRSLGHGWRGRHARRKEFLREIADGVEGLVDIVEPQKAKALAATKKFFSKYLQEGRESGILEEGQVRPNYLPHIIDYGKVRNLADEFHPDDIAKVIHESMQRAYLPHMEEVITKMTDDLAALEPKVKAANDDLVKYRKAVAAGEKDLTRNAADPDKKLAAKERLENAKAQLDEKIAIRDEIQKEFDKLKRWRDKYPEYIDKIQKATAKGYTRNMLHRGIVGNQGHMMGGIRLDDAADLRVKLKDAGLGDEEIEEIIEGISVHDPKRGSTGRAKPRVEFDMGYSTLATNKHTGETKPIHIQDLFSRDLDYIIPMYGRQMSGRIGISKVTGIKNDSEFKSVLQAWAEEAGSDAQSQSFKAAVRNAEYLYNAVVGNPLDADPSHWLVHAARRMRDYNFIVRGGAFVFAQFAEMGNVLGAVGIKALFKQMPILADIRTAFKGSRPDSQFMRQLEAMTGIATNRIRNQIFTSMDEDGLHLHGVVDKTLHNMKNAISDISGFNALMTMEARMAGAAMAQRLVDIARGVQGDITKLKPAQLRELKVLGFRTDKELQNVFSHLADDSKTKVSKSWGRVYEFNEMEWDTEAFNTMSLALQRAATKLVQENSYGTSIPLMHTTLGKVLFQFRSFAMNAVTKQTLSAMAQRDTSVLMRVLYGLTFGGLSYMGQTYITKKNTDKYEEAMSLDKIGLAAFSRMGLSSMIPAAVDSTIGVLSRGSVNGLWSHARSSGLGSGFITGNPTFTTLDSAVGAVTGSANSALRDDFDFSRDTMRDWSNLTPGRGLFFMSKAINTIMEDLPKKSFRKAVDIQDYFE